MSPDTSSKKLECEIRSLSPDLLVDYLAFFDQDAFSDNPQWASCYCHCYYFPHHLRVWKNQTAAENRAAVCQRISDRQMQGYLAYVEGKPVAWCNAAPYSMFTAFHKEPEPDQAQQIGAIVCFIVAPAYRGQGLASQLLEAACDGFQRQGLAIVEAYPRRDSKGSADNYKGPLSMYRASGFQTFREDGDTLVVRKTLE